MDNLAKIDRAFRLMLYASIGWTIGAWLGEHSGPRSRADAAERRAAGRPRRHTAVSVVRKAEPHFTLEDAQQLADERGEQVVFYDPDEGYIECYPRPKAPAEAGAPTGGPHTWSWP
jgi:hypothetical protein